MLAPLIGVVLGRCLLVAAWLAIAVPLGGALILVGLAADALARWWSRIHRMSHH